MATEWELVAFLSLLVVITTIPGSVKGKNFSLEIQNKSTLEEIIAVQDAVNDINSKNDSYSFTLQINNASQQRDLYRYSSSLIISDVIALLDFNSSPYFACTISNVTKIPVFRFHGTESYKMKETCDKAIIMSADYVSYAHATIQILDTFKWKKIALMADSSRIYEAASFESFTIGKGYTLSYIQIHHEENNTQKNVCSCDKAMKELNALDVDVVLLYTREKSFVLTMESCDPMKSYVWIIQEPITKDIVAHDSNMVVGFGLETTNGNKWSIEQETKILAYDAVLVVAMALRSIQDNRSHLLGNSNATLEANRKNLYKYAKQMKVNNTLRSPVQFDANGKRVVDKLQILNLVNNTFSKIGTWTKAGSILKLTDRIHFNKKSLDTSMLKGRQISVVTALTEPFQMRTVSADGKVTFYGFCIDILEKLASDLKFTYEIHLGKDGFYGRQHNGEWNGLMKELIDGNAEMIVAPLTRDLDRQKYVAMTASIMYYTDNLLMKKTIIEKEELLQFLAPFSKTIWAVTVVLLLAITLAVYILNYFSPYGYKNDQGTKTSEEFNLFNSFWFSIACMLQQGADNAPRASSGRILAGFFWFSILVWVSTYTANLAAFFTVETFLLPITSFEQAVGSDYDLGLTKESNLHSMFRKTEYDLYKQAWKRMKALPDNESQAMDWMRSNGRYIHILDGPILDYISQKKPCDLISIPGIQSPRSYVFALRQNDPHVQEISLAILHLRESGFIEKLQKKYWEGTNECPKTKSNRIKNKSIQLNSMAGVFIVLAAGCLIAFITLAIEIYWHRSGKEKLRSLKEKSNNNNVGKRSQVVVIGKTNSAAETDSVSTTDTPFQGWNT